MSDGTTGTTAQPAIGKDLLDILACPCSHHAPLRLEGTRLYCTDGACSRDIRVEADSPNMHIDQAEGEGRGERDAENARVGVVEIWC